jgi:hypothetical protein
MCAGPPYGDGEAMTNHPELHTNTARRTARTVGVLFLVTEVTAIAGLLLYYPVLKHSDYVLGAGSDTQIALAALLEVMLAIANIGTGVMLFPIIKKQHEGIALGYVCGRLLEAAIIVVGIISLLSVVTLQQDTAAGGTDPGTATAIAKSLVAIHDWTFLLGPGIILGVNSLMLSYLMHKSGLVPRFIARLGLVGGPLISLWAIAVLFGVTSDGPTPFALPVFAWEVSLAVWLIVKGFTPSPIIEDHEAQPVERDAPVHAAA